jgi:hypothetical protein
LDGSGALTASKSNPNHIGYFIVRRASLNHTEILFNSQPIMRMSALRTFETLASVKIIEFATQNAFVEYSDELLSY